MGPSAFLADAKGGASEATSMDEDPTSTREVRQIIRGQISLSHMRRTFGLPPACG